MYSSSQMKKMKKIDLCQSKLFILHKTSFSMTKTQTLETTKPKVVKSSSSNRTKKVQVPKSKPMQWNESDKHRKIFNVFSNSFSRPNVNAEDSKQIWLVFRQHDLYEKIARTHDVSTLFYYLVNMIKDATTPFKDRPEIQIALSKFILLINDKMTNTQLEGLSIFDEVEKIVKAEQKAAKQSPIPVASVTLPEPNTQLNVLVDDSSSDSSDDSSDENEEEDDAY